MASFLYDKFVRKFGEGTINSGDIFHAVLLTSAYTPSEAHGVYTDVSLHEVVGAGYIAGGKALTTVTFTETGGVTTLDADDISWPASSVTARYMAIISNTATNKDLVCLYDFIIDRTTSNTTFTVVFPLLGIITFTEV